MKKVFDHVGIPTEQKKPGEMYVAETKVWVTNPASHPYRIEHLRYEPESPVAGPVRDLPHVAFQVDDLDAAIQGEEVLLGPFHATDTLRVAFILKDGGVFELMEHRGSGHWFGGSS